MPDTALFTTAEARAFNGGRLASETDFPTATITAKEAEIREWLERVCGVNFVSATHTDEVHDGDGTDRLMLDWPLVTAISAAAYRAFGSSDWTDLTASQRASLRVSETGLVTYEGGVFTAGARNWRFTYTAGFATVPALVKRAALEICVSELPATSVSFAAEDIDAAGMSVSFGRGDGFGGAWHRIPDVVKAIRMYSYKNPGIV